MTGMSLVEFLRARLDEDERAAKAAADAVGPDWFSGPDSFAVWSQPSAPTPVAVGPYDEDLGERAGHIARHDPARVLAEVEAKRRIIDEHFGFLHPAGNPDRACRRCSDLRADDDPLIHMDRWIKLQPAPCTTLRLLALPYAGHPDYDEAWRV